MNILKAIVNIIIGIPNIPSYLILSILTVYRIYQNTNHVEFEFIDEQDMVTHEIKEYLNKVYPIEIKVTVALLFYSHLLIDFVI